MKKLFVLGLAFIVTISTDAVAMENQSLKFGLEQVTISSPVFSSLNIQKTNLHKDQLALNFVQTKKPDDRRADRHDERFDDRYDRYDRRRNWHRPHSSHRFDEQLPPPSRR